jgi:restriction system protein
LFGIMTAEHADEAVVVTSGRFTSEARAFAKGKPISLVDGPQLLDLVKSVQASEGGPVQQHVLPAVGDGAPGKVSPERGAAAERAIPSDVPQEPSPLCPQCGSRMVLRTAKRGERAGQQFWGCPAYPRCKGTRAA